MSYNLVLPVYNSGQDDYWCKVIDSEGIEYNSIEILNISYKQNNDNWTVYNGSSSTTYGRVMVSMGSGDDTYIKFEIKDSFRNKFKFDTEKELKIWLLSANSKSNENININEIGGYDLFDPDNTDKTYLKGVFDDDFTFEIGYHKTGSITNTYHILLLFAECGNGWNLAYNLDSSVTNYQRKQIFAEISDSSIALYDGTFYDKDFSLAEQYIIAIKQEIKYIPKTQINNIESSIYIICDGKEIELDKVELGSTISITSVANEGFIFNSSPYILYRDSETGDFTYLYFEKISDYEYVLTNFYVDANIYELIINSECVEEIEPEIEYLPITTALENCNCKFIVNEKEVEQGEIEKGSILTIEITAIEGYYFSDIPTYSYRDNNGNSIKKEFTKLTDSSYILTDFNTSLVSTTLTITANAISSEPSPEPEPKTTLTAVLDMSQCTIKAFDETGSELDINNIERDTVITFIVTANDGYYFATVPTITYYDRYGNQVVRNFNVSNDNPDNNYPTIFIYELDSTILKEDSSMYDFLIHGNATIKQEENPEIGFSGNYGIATYYNPSIENLRSIASDRQYIKEASYYVVIVDKGDFIAELRQVFMNFEVGEEENCYLGGYNMGFSCPVIANLVQNIEVGTYTFIEKYNNAYDYINVTIRAYLPFYGFFDIDPSLVMNKAMHVYYRVYIPTGDSIILIEVFNDNTMQYDVIYSLECNIAFKIPYLVQGQAYDTSNLFTNHKLLYGFTPFIEISRYKEQNTLHVKSYNNEYVQIKNLQGFCKCEEIFNQVKTTNEEKQMIEEILTNGFII